MSHRIRVYISGPLSQGNRKQNVRNAIEAGRRLIEAGFSVFVPHLSHYMDETDELGHDTWVAVDLQWVAVSDAVLRLPGRSSGADAEVRHAQHLGIPVYHDIEELIANPPPKGDPRFHALLRRIAALHDAKQRDYGREHDPFANVRGSSEWGVRPWVAAMVRATDKLRRLQQYARTGTLANEGAEDSFLDLAVYALIALILWREEQGLPPYGLGSEWQRVSLGVVPGPAGGEEQERAA
ncbi:MAG TPA: DUF4406 domain-containing protein [Gemmatimonadaceae bacterium]